MDNNEQIKYWNGEGGERWAQRDDTMARLLHPVAEALLDHAGVPRAVDALDIGCGGGSQSLLLAQRIGSQGSVLGVDISAPLLAVARNKLAALPEDSARVDFLQADAASHPFSGDSFDLLFSRFGVMFFDDPKAAFTNLRGALRSSGRLAFCCWQALRDNDWTRIPLQTALQFLPAPEAPAPNAPGPFAFADPDYIRDILHTAGYHNVQVTPHITTIRFGEAHSLRDSVRETATIGPVSSLLTGQDPALLEQVFSALEESLAPYYSGGALNLPGAIWFVTADNTED